MPTEQQIMETKWHWIGNTLRKPQGATERHALDWNPQGTRTRGRQRKPDYVSTQVHKIFVEIVFFSIFIACHWFYKLISYYTRHSS